MNMRVDETGRDQHARAIDLLVDLIGKVTSHEKNAVAFEDDFAVLYEDMPPVVVADDPGAPYP
jgi:hypothetical protein